MPKAIVLTQYCAPAAAPARAVAPRDRAGRPRLRAHYRSLADAREHATIDYCEEIAGIEPQEQAAALPPGVARYICTQAQDSGACSEPHRVLMIVAFSVPEARVEEVERWYREEHGPLLLRAPGWLRMRRYRLHHAAGGPRWTHLALHELRDLAVLDSTERAVARSTPWRARLEQESWFTQAGRWVYEYLPC
jgi:hypothetical protein